MGEPGFVWGDRQRRALAQYVHRAADASSSAVEDVGVDHRGAHVPVAQQLLDRPDIVSVLEQVGGEGVAEGVAGDVFLDFGTRRRILHGALEDRFVEVVAMPEAGLGFHVLPVRRENPLPPPSVVCFRVLSA